jgi:predicted small lipoprotein YifL
MEVSFSPSQVKALREIAASRCDGCGGQGFLYMPEDSIPCPVCTTNTNNKENTQ